MRQLDAEERALKEAARPAALTERVGFAGSDRIEWTLSTVAGDGYEVHVHRRR